MMEAPISEACRVVTMLRGGTARASKSIHGEFDLVSVIESGLPVQCIDVLAKRLGMSVDPLVDSLHLARRTIARRRSSGQRLDPIESERLTRLARVLVRAEDVLGSGPKAVAWIQRENQALAGRTPLSLLATDVGTNLALDVLGRIEHGVFG